MFILVQGAAWILKERFIYITALLYLPENNGNIRGIAYGHGHCFPGLVPASGNSRRRGSQWLELDRYCRSKDRTRLMAQLRKAWFMLLELALRLVVSALPGSEENDP